MLVIVVDVDEIRIVVVVEVRFSQEHKAKWLRRLKNESTTMPVPSINSAEDEQPEE